MTLQLSSLLYVTLLTGIYAAFSPTGGPLWVSIPIWANSFFFFARIGYERLGINQAVDFVSGALAGVQYNMNTIDPQKQTLSSSETAYLRMIGSSRSFQIYNNTMGQKILFYGTTTSGVRVMSRNLTYTLTARREIIVSAGAVSFFPLNREINNRNRTSLN
jgi:hypothetical protein